jgi:hypothetical protein
MNVVSSFLKLSINLFSETNQEAYILYLLPEYKNVYDLLVINKFWTARIEKKEQYVCSV